LKTILHVFGLMDKGGAELRTLEVCKKLKKEYRFIFLTLSDKEGSLDHEIINEGFSIYKSGNKLLLLKKLIQIIHKEKIDIVHSHLFLASGLIMLVSKLLGVNNRISHLRSTGNGLEGKITNDLKNIFLKRCTLLFSTKIVGVSEGVLIEIFKGYYEKSYKNKFFVLYNGFDIPNKIQKKTNKIDSKQIIHIGRQNKAKNHFKVIGVFYEYIKINPNTKLILVGRINPGINNEIERMISNLGIQGNVEIFGESNDIYNELNKSDLLLFPSIREGLPGVLLESIISKVPVLASDLSGVKEIKEFFPKYIFTKSLELDNKEWAKDIEKILNNNNYGNTQFENTPFYMANAISSYKGLWG
jgi:glycosyltransferase involved in cell wall biosynthesis